MKQGVPDISVVIAGRNEERFIGETIQSVLDQTHPEWEMIFVDDASTDKTGAIVKRFAKQDRRIAYLRLPHKKGVTEALNHGLKKARGRYIVRIDGDDVCLPERFSKQLAFLESNPLVFLVGSGAILINEEGTARGKFKPIPDFLLSFMLPRKNAIYHPSIMFRNDGTKYRDKMRFCQDYDFYLRLISEGRTLANIKEPLIKYRIADKSISTNHRPYQKMFEHKARSFYKERQASGKDSYEEFDPSEILTINAESTTNRIFLEAQVMSYYRKRDYESVRKYGADYIKRYGPFNRVGVALIHALTKS